MKQYVVPTGRVKVPAGRYVVPTGRVKVPAGRDEKKGNDIKLTIRAANILLQGIQRTLSSSITIVAKDIWENVKMILEGSELTKDDRESQL
ncbi:hypothetical protein Tco_0705475 [Tanacetum coccineum]|uniref:Uncharacterized protein n=1 Tax=Tanacetum coccineum TaxID=301880 RepID=A0ABQ4Y4V9_9ASTR